MDWSYRHLRGRLFAPDEKGGAGTVDEADETTAEETTEETTDTESTETEDEETEESEEEKQDEEPKVRDLTDDEIAERAKALGFVKPEEKEPEAKPEAKASKFDAPNFRAEAYNAVIADPEAKARGWVDEDGDITVEGQQVAENQALLLAAEHVNQRRDSDEFKRQMAIQKPGLVTSYTEGFKKNGLDDEAAPQVSKDYVDLLESYGERAFKEDDAGQKLRTSAYYVALGMQKEREIMAAKEGGEGGQDGAKAPITASDKNGGSLYAGVSKEDQDWLKNEWAKSKNEGKPPTRKQIEALKAEGVIG